MVEEVREDWEKIGWTVADIVVPKGQRQTSLALSFHIVMYSGASRNSPSYTFLSKPAI